VARTNLENYFDWSVLKANAEKYWAARERRTQKWETEKA
jgi:hypothetical protein